MDPRPRLTRPVHPLERPDGGVQLGLDPASAVVAVGVTAHECRWLSTLDGSRTLADAVDQARHHAIGAERAREIVMAFAEHGVIDLDGTPVDLDGRVVVVGVGSVPSGLVDVLREAGVREVVRCLDEPEDVRTDLVVITSPVPVPVGAGEPWAASGAAVLPIWCDRTHASIGPLLTPGDGPCLQCLELTRVGLDPGWSWIRAQISRPRVGPVVPVEADVPIRMLVVGLAAAVAVDTLTHGPQATGWSIDAHTPGPTLERRHWERHPGCARCGARHARPLSTDPQVTRRQWAG